MGKHRDRLNIIAAILAACGSGACKSRIISAANLNFKLLEKYLDDVIRAGLVQVEDQTYSLTEKGQEFLKRYRHYRERYINAHQFLQHLGTEYEQLLRPFEGSP